MSDEMMEMDNIITLTNEDGEEVKFEFLDLVEYQEHEYVVMLPVEEDDSMVVILEVIPGDDDEDSYVGVDSDEILDAVFAIFKDRFKDEFDFED